MMDTLCEVNDDVDNDIKRDDENEAHFHVEKSLTQTELQNEALNDLDARKSPKESLDMLSTCSSLATSPLSKETTSSSLSPQQAIRSHLRREFLRLISSFHKKKVLLKLYECPLDLEAYFEGCDPSFKYIIVRSLQTPIGLEKYAIIRTNDCIEIEFDHENKS